MHILHFHFVGHGPPCWFHMGLTCQSHLRFIICSWQNAFSIFSKTILLPMTFKRFKIFHVLIFYDQNLSKKIPFQDILQEIKPSIWKLILFWKVLKIHQIFVLLFYHYVLFCLVTHFYYQICTELYKQIVKFN